MVGQTEPHFLSDPMSDRKKKFRQFCVIFTKNSTVHDLAWRKCSSFSLYPQKFGCTPKNEGKRVHVPPDEKTCGHAGSKVDVTGSEYCQKIPLLSYYFISYLLGHHLKNEEGWYLLRWTI